MKLQPMAFIGGTVGALWQAVHTGSQVPLVINIAAVIVAICITGFGFSWLHHVARQWLQKHAQTS